MNTLNGQKIAIIADWLIDFGGAELVTSHLLEMFPRADIYTSVCFMEHPMLAGRNVYTSWLQKIPFLNRKHKLAGLLRPWAFRSFDLSSYDIVICSSSAESKQVAMGRWNSSEKGKVKSEKNEKKLGTLNFEPGTRKPQVFVYCHTPIRYYWSHAREYEDMMEFGILNPVVKWVFRRVKGWMQRLDYEAAQKVDFFIANSRTTAERIKKYYDRDATVIYPGIDPRPILQNMWNGENQKHEPLKGLSHENHDSRNHQNSQNTTEQEIAPQALHPELGNLNSPYYLGLGRCVPQKKFDLLVDAFNTNGKRAILCTGTDNALFRELRGKSQSNIEWRLRVSDEEKRALMQHATAFLFPSEDDFGLVPVEAMMAGTPVIAYGKGGGTESVIEDETGLFFTPQTANALTQTIEKFETMEWNREKIKQRGMEFSKEKFQENMRNFIEKYL